MQARQLKSARGWRGRQHARLGREGRGRAGQGKTLFWVEANANGRRTNELHRLRRVSVRKGLLDG